MLAASPFTTVRAGSFTVWRIYLPQLVIQSPDRLQSHSKPDRFARTWDVFSETALSSLSIPGSSRTKRHRRGFSLARRTKVKTSEIIRAWGKILKGEQPSLSIEITRECPLRCPGCYAYDDAHLGGGATLRSLADRKGQELIDGVLALVDRIRPLNLSIVGGEKYIDTLAEFVRQSRRP